MSRTPGSLSAAGGDPALARLRALLRAQIAAVTAGRLQELTALAHEVEAELARQHLPAADPRALHDVAHLQVQLENTLTAQARTLGQRLAASAAAAAYRRQALAGKPPHPG